MNNLNEIDKELSKKLIELIGYEKAANFLEKENYNHFAIKKKLLWCEITNIFKQKPIRTIIIFIILVIMLFSILAQV